MYVCIVDVYSNLDYDNWTGLNFIIIITNICLTEFNTESYWLVCTDTVSYWCKSLRSRSTKVSSLQFCRCLRSQRQMKKVIDWLHSSVIVNWLIWAWWMTWCTQHLTLWRTSTTCFTSHHSRSVSSLYFTLCSSCGLLLLQFHHWINVAVVVLIFL